MGTQVMCFRCKEWLYWGECNAGYSITRPLTSQCTRYSDYETVQGYVADHRWECKPCRHQDEIRFQARYAELDALLKEDDDNNNTS